MPGIGLTAVDAGAHGIDAIDSDANTSTGLTGNYTLASGDDNLTVDAGLYRPAAIGDFVWEDSNANGKQDAGEPEITRLDARQADLWNAVVCLKTTIADGAYHFTVLTP